MNLGQRPPIEHTCYCVYFSERSGSVVECLTPDRGSPGSSLTGITALFPEHQEDPFLRFRVVMAVGRFGRGSLRPGHFGLGRFGLILG